MVKTRATLEYPSPRLVTWAQPLSNGGMSPQDVNGEDGIVRYYDISPTNNSGLDATVQFSYLDHELNGIPENDLAPFRFNGIDWDEFTVSANDDIANWVETNSVDAFSLWTLALEVAPLPVELLSFTAMPVDNKVVELAWQTASEQSNEYFEIERSRDGMHFSVIGVVEGAGNSNEISIYQSLDDNPYAGENYYRIKQVDLNGNFEFSDIRVAEITGKGVQAAVYPNPASERINVEFYSSVDKGNIFLIDQSGRMILQKELSDDSAHEQLQVSHLPKGIYYLSIKSEELSFNQKIVLQ